MFSEENKVPRILFEARKMAGSAKYNQSKAVRNCVALLRSVCFICVFITKIK